MKFSFSWKIMMSKKSIAKNNNNGTPKLITEVFERYRPYLNKTEFNALINELDTSLSPAIRANCLKVDPMSSIHKWKDLYQWEIKDIPYYPFGWQIINSPSSISRTIEHQMGEYYIQDAASMLPVSLFDKTKFEGKLILDMAASPGGKTTQLIDTAKDKSFVIANDSSSSRLQALKIVLQNWGAQNFMITNFPGEMFGEWFPNTFDMVLLDAPCSMENLRPNVSHPARSITESERNRLALRQNALLISAFKALKPNGELIYSTCTLAPEEDEAVLDFLMTSYPYNAEIVKIQNLSFQAPAFTIFQDNSYHPQVKNALRLWPHILGTSGFFSAKILKSYLTNQDTNPSPTRLFNATGLQKLSENEYIWLSNYFQDNFGFSISDLLECQKVRLYRRKDLIFTIPSTYLESFQSLPYHTLGMRIGKQIGEEFIPSQEFVSRFGYGFTQGIYEIPSDLVMQWMSGQDLRGLSISNYRNRQIVLIKDPLSRNLGCGRLLPNRIRNLLPMRTI